MFLAAVELHYPSSCFGLLPSSAQLLVAESKLTGAVAELAVMLVIEPELTGTNKDLAGTVLL